MASALSIDTKPALHTVQLLIQQIDMVHAPLLLDYYSKNQKHLEPWEPERSSEYYSLNHFEQNTQKLLQLNDEGQAFNFVLLPKDSNQVIGVCNFTKVTMEPEPKCFLGYSISEDYQGKGFMFEALTHTIHYVFKHTPVVKIEAACILLNQRSVNLLARLGFIRESYRKKYLQINGSLEDHIIYTLNQNSYRIP